MKKNIGIHMKGNASISRRSTALYSPTCRNSHDESALPLAIKQRQLLARARTSAEI
jgi:hypothetical protein